MSEQLSLVQVSNCTLTTTAAEFEPSLDFEQWLEAGRRLCRVSACVNWWIGDWINYGEKQYGEKYIAAIETTGLDEQTLRQIAWVSNATNVSTRIQSLSWSHHREVAPLKPKDQKHWLALASENKWSVSQLRQAIRASQAEVKEGKGSTSGFSVVSWLQAGLRWFNQQSNEKPIEQWPQDRRALLKQELKPIVDVYERL